MEKTISPTPNAVAEVATHTLRPFSVCRLASSSAAASAPIPAQPVSQPSAFGPPCTIRSAKTGISTWNGMPDTLAMPSRMSRA